MEILGLSSQPVRPLNQPIAKEAYPESDKKPQKDEEDAGVGKFSIKKGERHQKETPHRDPFENRENFLHPSSLPTGLIKPIGTKDPKVNRDDNQKGSQVLAKRRDPVRGGDDEF